MPTEQGQSATAPSITDLVERLAAFDALRACPRPELEWLAQHGEFRRVASGAVVLLASEESREMIIQFAGRIVVYFGRGAGQRHVAESKAGSITGLLPFSRLKRPPSDVIAEEAAEFLAINRSQFPAMLASCPVLVEGLVHNMLDRARRFAAADWQDEKVLSLGRLAAGLAHELNNPASAASSGARTLLSSLEEVGAAAHAFGTMPLTVDQRALVTEVVGMCQRASASSQTALERSDVEDKIAEWLERHGIDDDVASYLADCGVPFEQLERVAASVSGEALRCAVRWIAAAASARAVAGDVNRATRRIHDVVVAMRDYTHMDRAAVREPSDIGAGLASTVEVIRCGPRANGVTITLDVEASLPRVHAVGPDLNQAWSHLIENAIDATRSGGCVTVRALRDGPAVVVAVADDGGGIPEDVQHRVFEPFFTTKPVGEGVGLGLHTVRRVAREFGGEVEFDTRPGRTEFRVRLPAIQA